MKELIKTDDYFSDFQQNFWQLACIQTSSFGVPGLIASGQLSIQVGIGRAITSVLIGNLILWAIGLSVISMSASERDNALQNIRKYLGKLGGLAAAIFLILAFFSWYILQLESAVAVIGNLYNHQQNELRWGAALGAFIALLSIGGIRLIKKYCLTVFPFLMLFILFLTFKNLGSFHISSWGISFTGIVMILSINLPGFVNLPTFFRHSKSKLDSYLALTTIIIVNIIFQTSTIFAGFFDIPSLFSNTDINVNLLAIFIIASLISVNLVNIYFAAAGWEMILPHKRSPKVYVIVGLLGTMAYAFLQISPPMRFLEDLAENFISSLGITLIFAFLVKIIVKHRPRIYEKAINSFCWIFGALTGTIIQSTNKTSITDFLIVSISSTSIAFLFFMFFEETIWSVKNLIAQRKAND